MTYVDHPHGETGGRIVVVRHDVRINRRPFAGFARLKTAAMAKRRRQRERVISLTRTRVCVRDTSEYRSVLHTVCDRAGLVCARRLIGLRKRHRKVHDTKSRYENGEWRDRLVLHTIYRRREREERRKSESVNVNANWNTAAIIMQAPSRSIATTRTYRLLVSMRDDDRALRKLSSRDAEFERGECTICSSGIKSGTRLNCNLFLFLLL